MSKVLGIEIGASKIRICEADYKSKNPKVYQSISIKTPEGVVNDGEIFLNEQLISVMKDALQIHKIKTKQIVFSMNSTKIASREIVIPFVKENKIGDLIKANASDYFPVDLEQYELGHTVLDTMENEKGVKQYKVLVLAAPKMMIQSYYQLAGAIGCTVAAMDYSGNSIYQAVRNHCGTGVEMVIKVDENSTLVTILENQAICCHLVLTDGICVTGEQFFLLVRHGSLELFFVPANQLQQFLVLLRRSIVFCWLNVAVPKFFKDSHTTSSS